MKKLLLASTALVMLAGAGAASAADLPSRNMAPVAPVYVPPAFTWTGFYVGVNAGYDFTNKNNNNLGAIGSSGTNGGFIGGAQIGYNYQFGVGQGFVIGGEADIQYVDAGGHKNSFGGYTFPAYPGSTFFGGNGDSGNYLGTVRARVGYAFDRFFIYGTGGLAYGDIGGTRGTSYAVTVPGGTLPFGGINGGAGNVTTNFGSTGGSSTRTGYTLGAGLEYAFTQNLSVKAEYLYYNLGHNGTSTFTPFFGSGKHDADGNIIRVGLNYKFW